MIFDDETSRIFGLDFIGSLEVDRYIICHQNGVEFCTEAGSSDYSNTARIEKPEYVTDCFPPVVTTMIREKEGEGG